MPSTHRAAPVLVCAVLVMAWAGPLVRLTDAPALAVAAWRLGLASLILLPLFLATGARAEWRPLPPRSRWIAVASGVALACHFASWIASLRLTSVAAAAVLVATSPVFAWLLSSWFLGERPSRRQAAGIVVAVAGAAVIALGDARSGGRSALLGDALAVTGAWCGAVYFVIGRHLRARLGLVAYITPVYGTAAVVLAGWAALRGQLAGPFAARDWAVFAALAVGPMLVGHTGMNYALRHMAAWAVGVAALGEPIGAALIAWLLPAIGEPPGAWAILGGAICLAGIGVTLTKRVGQ